MKQLCVLLMFLVSIGSFAQEEDQVDQFLDELFAKEGLDVEELLQQLDSNFLYLNTSFSNPLYFSGRDYDVDQFALSPQISYYFSNGFSISWLSNYFSESESVWDNHSLSLYYLHKVSNSPISLMGGVSRVLYSNSLYEDQTNVSLGGSIDFDNYHYGGSFYLNTNPSDSSSLQCSMSLYAKWELLTNEDLKLTFRPDLSFLWSNYTYAQTTERMNGMTFTRELSDHSLVNSQLKLPLHLYLGNFDIQCSYNLNFPKALKLEDPIERSSYVSISLGYFIR